MRNGIEFNYDNGFGACLDDVQGLKAIWLIGEWDIDTACLCPLFPRCMPLASL
jgi:hypothetical protein